MEQEIVVVLISFAVSTILGLIIIPILRRLKVGQIEREDGPKTHLKKQGTPTMGGIILIITMLIILLTIYGISLSGGNIDLANKILPIFLITIGFGLIGFIDDFKKLVLKNTKGLKPRYKIVGLLIISIIYVLYLIYGQNIGTDIYIPFAKTSVELGIYIYIPFSILVILGTTNAINLTDGVDGLAPSVSAIILTCLTIIGVNYNMPEISIFGSIAIGAIIGFLMYNLHPAKVFLGDTGSLLVGGLIAAIALYLKLPLLLPIICIIPVLETLSVMIQVAYFKRTGKRFFNMAPLHHHFELNGWKENKVVTVFTLITLLVCVIGLKII